jgi:voltage-dependent calcium channel
MSIFLLLATFLAALFGIQLIRDDVPTTFNENFQGLVTAFLAMYQLLSSENWETVMWAAANAEYQFKQQVIVIIFMVIWLYFANCEFTFWLCWTYC